MDKSEYTNYLNLIKRSYGSSNGPGLGDIPEEYRTEELCIAALRKNGWELKYVKNQTEAICIAAVKQSGNALFLVEKQTPAICMAAVKQYGGSLEMVKEQTLEICLEAVTNNGISLKHVKNQTPQICLEAIKNSPNAIEYVNDLLGLACIVKDDFIDSIINKSVYGYLYLELKEIKHRIMIAESTLESVDKIELKRNQKVSI